MLDRSWQKSSYCGQGESCLHVAGATQAVRLTESGDPGGVILGASPDAFGSLLRMLKEGRD
ncbi:DUF397 domain-containing protein [Streptomyces sp. 8P21H-1]|uniref:DUF397 domain-containing protein n=1 Tax=Streptomyces sp. 8P21H-1 TaxID=2737048 RepID=UPI0015707E46|nr:DUF397 domain-containing protein [Streptomyces sp. 8P21H-1]NSL43424.1 DUF397 domain-containing protein [Streptomyces sp. 8P21H-1]